MKTVTRRGFVGGVALLPALHFSAAHAQAGVSPAEARTIAKEAYVYGFPIVDNYRIQHAYWMDKTNPEYKGPFNQIWNSARVYTPADTAIQTPNSDTPYSFVGADLRSEPLVLTVPAMEKERYSASSSSIITPLTSTISAHAHLATEAAASCLPGRDGRVTRPRASRKCSAARPNLRSPRIARSSLIQVTSTM